MQPFEEEISAIKISSPQQAGGLTIFLSEINIALLQFPIKIQLWFNIKANNCLCYSSAWYFNFQL